MGLLKYDGDASQSMPFYVTRKTASGETMQYDMPMSQSIKAMLLIYLNIVLWGVIGLLAGVTLIIVALYSFVSAVVGLF